MPDSDAPDREPGELRPWERTLGNAPGAWQSAKAAAGRLPRQMRWFIGLLAVTVFAWVGYLYWSGTAFDRDATPIRVTGGAPPTPAAPAAPAARPAPRGGAPAPLPAAKDANEEKTSETATAVVPGEPRQVAEPPPDALALARDLVEPAELAPPPPVAEPPVVEEVKPAPPLVARDFLRQQAGAIAELRAGRSCRSPPGTTCVRVDARLNHGAYLMTFHMSDGRVRVSDCDTRLRDLRRGRGRHSYEVRVRAAEALDERAAPTISLHVLAAAKRRGAAQLLGHIQAAPEACPSADSALDLAQWLTALDAMLGDGVGHRSIVLDRTASGLAVRAD